MKRKSFTPLFGGFSAIVLVLSLILSPIQAFAMAEATEEIVEPEIETVQDQEQLETGQAEETANLDEPTEENVVTEESAVNMESEGLPADESEEAEVAVNTETEAQQEENETEKEVDVPEEELAQETENSNLNEEYGNNPLAKTEQPKLKIFKDLITKDSISISWEVSGQPEIEEFEVYLDDELLDTVSPDTTSYTFEGLKTGVAYEVRVIAVTQEGYIYSPISTITPYWTEEELVPVIVQTNVGVDLDYFDELMIRGNEESTEGYEDWFQLYWVNGNLVTTLPVGKFEAVLYNKDDPSYSESTIFEIKDGINYKNNPIQLQFNLEEMRENAEPFEYEIVDISETSFTIRWSDVSKLLGISLDGSGSDLVDTKDYLDEIQLNNNTREYTVTGLLPNLLYTIYLDLYYDYGFEVDRSVKVKTDGEDAEAPEVPFENDHLKQAVSEEVGVHTRDVTENDILYLRDLDVYNGGVDSLKGLEFALNLTRLTLFENAITDLLPLGALENLEQLAISYNQVRDLSPLENLTNLTTLVADNNKINDLSPLGNLTNLNTLYVANNEIENIDILGKINQIKSLDIAGNPITDYSVVKDLTNLSYLSMGDLNISDLNFLSNLKKLYGLNLDNNKIEDIQILSGLKNLGNLNLSGNGISDITTLEDLTNLLFLRLKSNNITDISPLANLKEIVYLDISDNPIKGVSVLGELPNLEEVYLYGVELSNDDYELLERLFKEGVQVYHEDFIDKRDSIEDPEEEEPGEEEGTEDGDTGSDNEGTEDNNTGSDDKETEDDETAGVGEGKGSDGGKESAANNAKTETSTSTDGNSEVTGAKLPNTATNIYNLILLGTIILAAGIISLYFTSRTKAIS